MQVSEMAEICELHQQRGNVAAHVIVDLLPQVCQIFAMKVMHNGRGHVSADAALRQNPVPELGIPTATRGSGIQPLIEPSGPFERLPADRHVAADADVPDGRRLPAGMPYEISAVQARFVSSIESTEVELKQEL
ncbi:MAG: hypothetical protein JWO80_2266, partial [Bryobacterales bacterium]|nr:hypothetical protein [Bryobacterales bacterium]